MKPELRIPITGAIKRKLNIGEYDPFPYKGLWSTDTVFNGTAVCGYLQTTKRDATIGLGQRQRVVPAGTRFIELHVIKRRVDVYDGQFADVLGLLIEMTCDMRTLAGELSHDPSLADIDLIGGNTNRRLARLAINKLGFSLVYPKKAVEGKGTVAIYMTRDELVNKRLGLIEQAHQLIERKRRREARVS